MATENITTAAESEVYIADELHESTIVNPDCPPERLYDAIHMRLSEVRALALISQCDGFEEWNNDVKCHYINIIARHANEIEAMLHAYHSNGRGLHHG